MIQSFFYDEFQFVEGLNDRDFIYERPDEVHDMRGPLISVNTATEQRTLVEKDVLYLTKYVTIFEDSCFC